MIAAFLLMLVVDSGVNTLPINKDELLAMRQNVLAKERQMQVGGAMNLSDAELRVNAILMKFKANELEVARRNATNFPPAMHFFRAKTLIDDSEVFKIIRTIPKGKLLGLLDNLPTKPVSKLADLTNRGLVNSPTENLIKITFRAIVYCNFFC